MNVRPAAGGVPKDRVLPAHSGSSFETPAPQAPPDEAAFMDQPPETAWDLASAAIPRQKAACFT
ncbi:hypothetical protein J4G37_15975 [Microvirga sp. 3-52]|nr:hypothetical protein [Microvirga sp. 3-52]